MCSRTGELPAVVGGGGAELSGDGALVDWRRDIGYRPWLSSFVRILNSNLLFFAYMLFKLLNDSFFSKKYIYMKIALKKSYQYIFLKKLVNT